MAELSRIDLSSASNIPTRVRSDLDPRLQLLVARRQAGMVKLASTSTAVDEVAVVARVSNYPDWEALSEVREPTLIGETPDTTSIVTGRVPVRRIEAVRSQPFVLSLKAGRDLRPMLSATTQETGARPALLPAGSLTNGGAGVVVGVIDYGGDFAHQNFRRADSTTRLLTLWFQDGPTTATSPFGYGRVFTPQELNLALQQSNPYQAAGYDPADFEDPTDPGAHGTHVMDIAAGNGRGTGVPGMAPEADLIFVNISDANDPQGTAAVGKSFGDSIRLLEALKYIFTQAGNQPCVVNISLGTNGGPHDGSTLVEQGIDSLLRAAPNRAVVIAAANAFDDGIHSAGTVAQGQATDLEWELVTGPLSDIELEVWYPGADRFTIELLGPNGDSLATVAPGAPSQTLMANGQVAVLVANRLDDPNNHDNMIGIFLSAGMPSGIYTVRLHGDQVSDGRFHAWIERDDRFQSRFTPPNDNTHTIGSVSCSHLSLAVGSYDAHKAALPLSFFSSAGPTRDGREKPEVSAPGHNVLAAQSSTKIGARRMSGTSMASPAVAGLVALVLAEARAHGQSLPIDDLRDIVISTARRNPPPGTDWHDRFGHGRVSATAAVQAVI
ncbi:MAG TPA: S8 family peptidase, partial [Thermoanaerobaculia bacterium]|nr:S8 family peptidase [Thermoanaerobaculia bacterium]